MSQTAAISVEDLVVTRGGRQVVQSVSLDVRPGELVALLGPNGAGKTTVIETILGLSDYDSGSVALLGIDPQAGGAELRARVGVMLQEGGLYPALKPIQCLQLFAGYYRNGRTPEEVLKLVGLEKAGYTTPYRRLSGGEKQRASLAAALIGNPDVLFLDEPTTGLDVEARLATWELIRAERNRGVAVLLTTHLLEEAEALADRVAVMSNGRLIAVDTPSAILRQAADIDQTSTIRVRTLNPLQQDELRDLKYISGVVIEGPTSFVAETECFEDAVIELAAWSKGASKKIVSLSLASSSLETAFLSLVEADRAQ